jgi:hypothetical protein
VQVFLLGQSQFNKTLALPEMEQLQQRVVATYNLKAFNEEQTKDYILFRLNRAGWQQRPYFEDDVFPLIFKNSQGIPRKINTLCERVMMLGFLDELQVINGQVIQRVIDDIAEEQQIDDSNRVADSQSTRNDVQQDLENRVASIEKSLKEICQILQAYHQNPEP